MLPTEHVEAPGLSEEESRRAMVLRAARSLGVATVADLCELAATRTRLVHSKRVLAFGAPEQPGVYLFRDAHDQVLYVGVVSMTRNSPVSRSSTSARHGTSARSPAG